MNTEATKNQPDFNVTGTMREKADELVRHYHQEYQYLINQGYGNSATLALRNEEVRKAASALKAEALAGNTHFQSNGADTKGYSQEILQQRLDAHLNDLVKEEGKQLKLNFPSKPFGAEAKSR